MSFTSSHKAKLLLGASELTAKLTQATVSNDTEMLDVTTLADQSKRFIAGLNGHTLNVEGWADSEAVSIVYTAMNTAEAAGVNSVATYGPAGLTVGAGVILAAGKRNSFEQGTAVGGVANFSAGVTGDGQVGYGNSLHALTAETIDGSGTSYDRGLTSTAGGAVAHLHVSAFSGLTNNIVTIEDSANDSAWSTIGTFATYTATTAERIVISGTIRRYVRCSWNVTGTGSTTFAVAIAPL